MEIQFLGANRVVTGSCYLITVDKKKFLVDCGMFQGDKELRQLNRQEFLFDPKEISHVLLTHAHIDHSGLIPKLYKHGFRGKVICTRPTKDLCKIMLEDSAMIQEENAKREDKKPIFDKKDAKNCMGLFKTTEYDKENEFLPGIKATYRDGGHIIGSAIIELKTKDKKIVFSGDLGQKDVPIVKNPTKIKKGDYLVVESTYGSRVHEDKDNKNQLLLKAIKDIQKNKGVLIIPVFAIERTQEIIYRINNFVENNKVENVEVYVDAPLGDKATKIFEKYKDFYDKETKELLKKGDNPFAFEGLYHTSNVEESKKLNRKGGPMVIMAGSGMCTGGRVVHHLKHHLGNKNTHLLFVGYQAKGTLGRQLRDGKKKVEIYGRKINVRAKVSSIGGFSAHGDQPELVEWVNNIKGLKDIFITHGEYKESKGLKKALGKGHIPILYESKEL